MNYAYAPVAAEDAPEILQKAIGWLMKCLWQQQPELAEDHMAAYLQEGLYTRLIVRIGLERQERTTEITSWRRSPQSNYRPK